MLIPPVTIPLMTVLVFCVTRGYGLS